MGQNWFCVFGELLQTAVICTPITKLKTTQLDAADNKAHPVHTRPPDQAYRLQQEVQSTPS